MARRAKVRRLGAGNLHVAAQLLSIAASLPLAGIRQRLRTNLGLVQVRLPGYCRRTAVGTPVLAQALLEEWKDRVSVRRQVIADLLATPVQVRAPVECAPWAHRAGRGRAGVALHRGGQGARDDGPLPPQHDW